MTEKYKKILFELQQDEDGYPPDKWESLWAYETAPRSSYKSIIFRSS